MKKILIAAVVVLACLSCSKKSFMLEPSASDLQFNDLATVWDEAMPLGNATIGTLVWEKNGRLRFSLDRSDLWDLRPTKQYQGEHFSFDWVKKHIRSGNYQPVIDSLEQSEVAPSKIPGAAMEFDSEGWGKVTSSRLFLNNALCQVNWDSGIRLTTFVQADRPVGWFVFDNAPEDFKPHLLPPAYVKDSESEEDGSLQQLGYEQGVLTEGDQIVTYHQKGWGDFYYDVAIAWKRQGTRVVGAWSITSSMCQQKADDEVKKALAEGAVKSYGRHMDYWKPYWKQSVVSVPDSVVQHQYDREIYKFGSASRKDSYPISLQAVWTADDGNLPPWKGDFHHDLNTQLSYWPAYSGNRLDEGLAYINTLWNQRDTYKEFTKTFFGKYGINVPGTCDLAGHVIKGWVPYTMSQTTSAWLAHHFYLHWKYSADNDFLAERGYPFVSDVALFLEQQSEVGEDGVRRLEYSSSPEINNNSIRAWFPDFTNFDLALVRFTFLAASEMADSLGRGDEAKHWNELAVQLPEASVDAEGALTFAPSKVYDGSHRHFSHAMAIHPLGLIDVSHGEKDRKIIDKTLDKLYEKGPNWWCGYSYSWLSNIEARARHGEKARDALRTFAECFCLRNSFHANGDQSKSGKSEFLYRPFTLEGNFAYAAGLQEMLLQSQTGVIDVFPAIPSDWQNVKFEHLRAIGAFLVSAEKKDGKVISLTIFSEKGGEMKVRHPQTGELITRQTKAGETVRVI